MNIPLDYGAEYTPKFTSDRQARDLILQAIETKDCHTLRQIREFTKLPDETIHFETGILQGIEIDIRPAPPVTTFWEKGKAPKGKIFIGADGKVKIIEESQPKDFTAEIQRRNHDIEIALKNLQSVGVQPVLQAESAQSAPVRFVPPKDGSYVDLPLSVLRLHQNNPRDFINTSDEAFIALTESIREKGVQEPLLVSLNPDGKTYRIVAGNRRFKASEAAGMTTAPCVIKTYPSAEYEQEVMIIENTQREDLTPTQLAKSFQKLLKTNDIHAVARKTGHKQSRISLLIRLLKLAPEIQLLVDAKQLTISSAKELARLPFEEQKKLLPRIQKQSLEEVAELVRIVKSKLEHKVYKPQKGRARVTRNNENFTRSGAIKTLNNLRETYFSPFTLAKAFDDVCLDSCLEQKDQSICHSCPVPRFIESVVRRTLGVNK